MYVFLIILTFLVNSLFMMLTTLLPILIFEISKSTSQVGYVLTTFMISLLATRLMFLKKEMTSVKSILYGSVYFFIGFLILNIFKNSLQMYYIGSILFGIAIGLIPPAILTILTTSRKKSETNISIYNSFVAIASSFSPILAESIFDYNSIVMIRVWFIGAVIMLIFSVLIFKQYNSQKEIIWKESQIKKNVTIFGNKMIWKNFIVLLFSSISYGAIISYLPIYFSSIKISIGEYYLFFWIFYVIAQFLKKYVTRLISGIKLVILLLIGLIIGDFLISFGSVNYLFIISGLVYGFCYGLLYNLFYSNISHFESEKDKKDGYAIIGLLSYIGVGIAPIFLKPFLKLELKMLFLCSSIYVLFAIVYYLFQERNKNKERI